MMKYSAEQQVAFNQLFSAVKGALLRLRPLTSAFVGMRDNGAFSRKAAQKERCPHGQGKAVRGGEKLFSFGSLLDLRTFAFIIVGTVLLVVYINNLLTINSLSRENEGLRESIGISKSINAALELELQELFAIHNISDKAGAMGLKATMTPAVTIAGE